MSDQKTRGKNKKKFRWWTDQEDQFVRDNISTMTDAELAEELDRTPDAVSAYRLRKGIESPRDGRFKKGQESFNKGMKQEEFMSEEAIEATKATRFKSGHKPHNTKWDGAITIRHDHPERGGPPYMYIRLSEGEWEKYQRVLWQKENGEIPEDKILVCKNGNTLNPDPDNWELITRAENARRNHNPEKASESLRKYWAEHEHPARDLTDNYLAGILCGGDEEMKDFLLNERPDLIRLTRANYKLRREVTNGSDKE